MIRYSRRTLLVAALVASTAPAAAQTPAGEPFKIGVILPMSGPFASTGRQIEAAIRLYVAEKGATVAGRKIEILLRDDTGSADVAKRIAQEMVVNEKVGALAGMGLTPIAFAVAPIATQARVPLVVMAAATSSIIKSSPYVLRTSYTTPQAAYPIAQWAAKAGAKRPVTIVTDYGPGVDSETAFKASFEKTGGKVLASLRVPLMNPDFSPFLQRVGDEGADVVFAFMPSGAGALFMKQFADRGLAGKGVRLIVEGGVTDDDILNQMGDAAIGVISGYHYSTAHDSPANKAFVEGFKKANPKLRPNFMAVAGWDGMEALYRGLEKTGGKGDGPQIVEAVKGMSWESPRGPISIDPKTREIVQNMYMRKVERGPDGELYNVEFETVSAVSDPSQ
ncbi:MAG TPA: ABC transporter substrate-binding protein [Beijerinckiaceae bacterium]